MNRASNRWIWLGVIAAFAPAVANAQQRAKPASEPHVVKVYRVVDLVSPAPNYPYLGTYLPAMQEAGSTRPLSSAGMGMGGMGGGMMGGTGGGMGGGMFQVPDHLAQVGGGGGRSASRAAASQRVPVRTTATGIDMDDLIEAITTTIDPDSWDEVGGPGAISEIGGAVAIRQTPAIQAKVQEFLEAVRRESGALRTITIEARWLALDTAQVNELRRRREGAEAISTSDAIDRAALAALPPEAERDAGRITCLNGQTVHIVSGRIETAINGAIPVVGGTEVGYQPVMFSPHLGVLLQITPSALPEGDEVLVNLHSTVTRWEQPGEVARIGTTPDGPSTVDVDRISVTAQQFATSMRMRLDTPMLVGGVSSPFDHKPAQAPAGAAAAETGTRRGLYLVLEIHASGDAAPHAGG